MGWLTGVKLAVMQVLHDGCQLPSQQSQPGLLTTYLARHLGLHIQCFPWTLMYELQHLWSQAVHCCALSCCGLLRQNMLQKSWTMLANAGNAVTDNGLTMYSRRAFKWVTQHLSENVRSSQIQCCTASPTPYTNYLFRLALLHSYRAEQQTCQLK